MSYNKVQWSEKQGRRRKRVWWRNAPPTIIQYTYYNGWCKPKTEIFPLAKSNIIKRSGWVRVIRETHIYTWVDLRVVFHFVYVFGGCCYGHYLLWYSMYSLRRVFCNFLCTGIVGVAGSAVGIVAFSTKYILLYGYIRWKIIKGDCVFYI